MSIEPCTSAPGDEDVGAFVDKLLRGRKANAAIAAGNQCNFSFKLARLFRVRFHLCDAYSLLG